MGYEKTLLLQLGAPLRTEGTPVRLLGVGVTGLSAKQQLSLWDEEGAASPTEAAEAAEGHPPAAASPCANIIADKSAHIERASVAEIIDSSRQREKLREKQQKLLQTIHALEQRFGTAIVQRGCDIQREPSGDAD